MKVRNISIIVVALLVVLCLPLAASAQYSIEATSVSSSQIDVTWHDDYYNELSWEVTRQTQVSGVCTTPYSRIAILPPIPGSNSSYTYHDTGLSPNTTYCYIVLVQLDTGYYSRGPVQATTFLAGTSTPVPTPTPTPTPLPEFTLQDYHFMNPMPSSQDMGWKGYAGATWAFSRYNIPTGGFIAQNVTYITGTHTYAITLRASAPTTSTIALEAGSSTIATFTITRTRMATYAIETDVELPATIKVRTTNGGPITVDRFGMEPEMGGEGFQSGSNNPSSARSLDLAEFTDWFQALELPETPIHSFGPFNNINWNDFMYWVGSIMATLLAIATPQIVGYYIAGRIGLLAVIWFFSFVMNKIGHRAGVNMGSVGFTYREVSGLARSNSVLPKLPPSGIRQSRRRRSSWP